MAFFDRIVRDNRRLDGINSLYIFMTAANHIMFFRSSRLSFWPAIPRAEIKQK